MEQVLHKSLLEMGFLRCKSDLGAYFKIISEDLIILLIYVDNTLFMGSNKTQVLSYKAQFMRLWESKDLGQATKYLDIRMSRDCKK